MFLPAVAKRSQACDRPARRSRRASVSAAHGRRMADAAVDTDGRLLMINLTTADISDSAGAQHIVGAIRKRWPWLKYLFADGDYDRTRLLDAASWTPARTV